MNYLCGVVVWQQQQLQLLHLQHTCCQQCTQTERQSDTHGQRLTKLSTEIIKLPHLHVRYRRYLCDICFGKIWYICNIWCYIFYVSYCTIYMYTRYCLQSADELSPPEINVLCLKLWQLWALCAWRAINGRRLIISISELPTSIWYQGWGREEGGTNIESTLEWGKKQSMLNALLNLLLFYNKIYAFHLVAVARRQKVHRTREEVEEWEGGRERWTQPGPIQMVRQQS